jgi:phosphatidylinositol kinase/protein kinase (PI-3  family)
LAAYSLVCYILQIKDRHNGNIMVDIEGHIMHIDFGFLLSNAPGKGIKFEQAPFKLTAEMVEVLGGIKTKKFREYREQMRLGFMAL